MNLRFRGRHLLPAALALGLWLAPTALGTGLGGEPMPVGGPLPDPGTASSAGSALGGLPFPSLLVFAFLVIIGGTAVYGLLRVDPAWPLSLGIVATVFSGNWGALGLPPLDRALLAIGVASLIGRYLMGSTGLRLRPGPVHALLALTIVVGLISAQAGGTLGESDAFFGLVDRLGLLPFAMFILAPIAFRTRYQRAVLTGSLTVLGAYLGITAVLETLDVSAFIWPSYITDPTFGLHPERARGPFVESAANGLALMICAAAAVITARSTSWVEWKWASYAIAILCTFGTLLTLTRAIWLGTALGIVLAMIVARDLRRYLVPLAAGAAVSVVLALALIPSLGESASTRESDNRPVWDRLNLIEAGGNMLAEKPLFGFGWNRFEREAPPYFRQNDDFPIVNTNLRIHNVFLSNAVELGLIGASIWLLGLTLAIGGALVTRGPPELYPFRLALVAIAVQWAVVANFVPLFFLFPNLVLWTWAGIVSSWYAEPFIRSVGARLPAPLRRGVEVLRPRSSTT